MMISKETLENMYLNKKMSVNEIARELNVEYKNVEYRLRKYRINKRKYSISKEKLIDMYVNKEMSMNEIVREFNVTPDIIRYLMRKYQIKMKSISEITKGRSKPSVRGELNGNWKGGTSFEPYCHKFNSDFKNDINMRDDYTCQLCGHVTEPDDNKLCIHHVHYDKPNCEPDVIALCNSCNVRANFNRGYWEEHFENLLRSRGLLIEA